jgi:MFS family permease
LLISGIVSPAVGGLVDAQGGRFVLSWGSVLGAVALALIASARGFPLLLLGWSVAGVAMAACLYDPAFATLHQLTGTSSRRAVTALTLFGGFASTVFWPASQWLLDSVGWRETLWSPRRGEPQVARRTSGWPRRFRWPPFSRRRSRRI